MDNATVQELAERPYDKQRFPEAPYQVHQERQALAKRVLELEVPASMGKAMAQWGLDLQEQLRAVEKQAGKNLLKVNKQLQRLEKKLQRAQEAAKGRKAAPRRWTPLQRAKKAVGPKHPCAVKGCGQAAFWKLACEGHLKRLPADIRQVLMTRQVGKQGRASKEWVAAATKAWLFFQTPA